MKCFLTPAPLAHFLSRSAKPVQTAVASDQSANKNTPFFTDAIPPFTYNRPPMAYLPWPPVKPPRIFEHNNYKSWKRKTV